MKVMEGHFKSTLPYKELNIRNLKLHCSCRFITLKKMKDGSGRVQFLMEPKCLKHLLKYAEWKLGNKETPMKGLNLDYTYNEYPDGTTGVIK